MRKFKINPEMAVAVAAMLTAVAATIVSVMQTGIMRDEAEMERRHARLSAMPSVWVFKNTSLSGDTPLYEVIILNKGLGPATIEQFEVLVDGKPVRNWNEVISTATDGAYSLRGENRNVPEVGYSAVPYGHIMPAESDVKPFRMRSTPDLVGILSVSQRISYKLCVCSIFEECWETNGMATRPEPVKACTYNRETYFEG